MRLIAATLAIVFALATSINAQIAQSPGSTVPPPSYLWDIMDGLVTLIISDEWDETHGATYSFDILGYSDDSHLIDTGHKIRNNTSRTWVGFRFDTVAQYPFVAWESAPSSDVMTLVSSTNTSLVFGTPSPVYPGESVHFLYAIDAGGEYRFTLTQTPITIPEPSGSMLLPITFLISMSGRLRSRC